MSRLGLTLSIVVTALAALAGPAAAATATGPPTASTGKASSVTPNSAQVTGTINPHGHPTSYYFQFGTSKSYTSRTGSGDAGAGTATVNVAGTLTGLQPNTTYHYQLVAFSTAGTSRGGDKTLKTPQIPTVSTINAVPNPTVFGGVVSVTGFLTGPAVGSQEVALQANAFPFTGGFQQLGNSVITTPQGGYSFLIFPTLTSQLRVVDKSKPSVTSPVITESVALKSTLSIRRSRTHPNHVVFSGHVLPAKAGNAVLIQRSTSKGFKTVGVTLTKTKTATFSGFAKALNLRKGGTFRAVIRTTGGDYVDGTSRVVRVGLR